MGGEGRPAKSGGGSSLRGLDRKQCRMYKNATPFLLLFAIKLAVTAIKKKTT
jgi:hypothetical protein